MVGAREEAGTAGGIHSHGGSLASDHSFNLELLQHLERVPTWSTSTHTLCSLNDSMVLATLVMLWK